MRKLRRKPESRILIGGALCSRACPNKKKGIISPKKIMPPSLSEGKACFQKTINPFSRLAGPPTP